MNRKHPISHLHYSVVGNLCQDWGENWLITAPQCTFEVVVSEDDGTNASCCEWKQITWQYSISCWSPPINWKPSGPSSVAPSTYQSGSRMGPVVAVWAWDGAGCGPLWHVLRDTFTQATSELGRGLPTEHNNTGGDPGEMWLESEKKNKIK